jgi:hypothetical protein
MGPAREERQREQACGAWRASLTSRSAVCGDRQRGCELETNGAGHSARQLANGLFDEIEREECVMGTIVRALLPREYEWVLSKADELEPPDVSDITIEQVGAGQRLTAEQREFLLTHIRPMSIWYLMRWVRRGEGWFWMTRNDGKPSSSMFANPARRYRRIFPVITEEKAMNIGPGYTVPEFRGLGLYTRMVRYAAVVAKAHGWGPFYGQAWSTNPAALRGIEKTGMKRVGVWAGRRAFFNLLVNTRKVSD